MNKAEIDTSTPFRSVKEAVILFGDKLLTSEVYGSRLKEIQEERTLSEYTNLTHAELQEAKQSLQKARRESSQMATTLFFLQQELEKTRTELQQLKTRGHYCRDDELDLDILEDIKFVEEEGKDIDQTAVNDLQKDKPCVAQVNLPDYLIGGGHENVLQRQPSIRGKKTKQAIEFIRRIFIKRCGRS